MKTLHARRVGDFKIEKGHPHVYANLCKCVINYLSSIYNNTKATSRVDFWLLLLMSISFAKQIAYLFDRPGRLGPDAFFCSPPPLSLFILVSSAFNALTFALSPAFPPCEAVFVTFLHRFAKSKEFPVSGLLKEAGLQQTNMRVFALPPIESLMSIVNG